MNDNVTRGKASYFDTLVNLRRISMIMEDNFILVLLLRVLDIVSVFWFCFLAIHLLLEIGQNNVTIISPRRYKKVTFL